MRRNYPCSRDAVESAFDPICEPRSCPAFPASRAGSVDWQGRFYQSQRTWLPNSRICRHLALVLARERKLPASKATTCDTCIPRGFHSKRYTAGRRLFWRVFLAQIWCESLCLPLSAVYSLLSRNLGVLCRCSLATRRSPANSFPFPFVPFDGSTCFHPTPRPR